VVNFALWIPTHREASRTDAVNPQHRNPIEGDVPFRGWLHQ
jgi:hypothetical protein